MCSGKQEQPEFCFVKSSFMHSLSSGLLFCAEQLSSTACFNRELDAASKTLLHICTTYNETRSSSTSLKVPKSRLAIKV